MTNSIQFDSTEILTSAYLTQFAKHETVSERMLTTLQLAREDGAVLISDRRGGKVITLRGTLVASSQANLDAAIDTFNELFSRKEKNLDISWNGSTRRYVATCTSHTYDRDHYNTTAVPWTAEFTVLSGEGKDTSATTALNAHAINIAGPVADSFTISGSKPAKPYITVKGNSFYSQANGMEYKNTDTGEKLVVIKQTPLSVSDSFILDCLNKKVYWQPYTSPVTQPVEYPFYGVFPTFKVGTNNVQITCGGIANQTTLNSVAGGNGEYGFGQPANDRFAQSFSIPYSDATFSAIVLEIYRVGVPGSFHIEIQSDSNGSPSGVLADYPTNDATVTYGYTSIGTTIAQVTFYPTNRFTLQANTKYWIVISSSGMDASNYYAFGKGVNYSKGTLKKSLDAGSTYSVYEASPAAFAFSLLYGGVAGSSNAQHTVSYTKTYL